VRFYTSLLTDAHADAQTVASPLMYAVRAGEVAPPSGPPTSSPRDSFPPQTEDAQATDSPRQARQGHLKAMEKEASPPSTEDRDAPRPQGMVYGCAISQPA
jgi:hypothetical protein